MRALAKLLLLGLAIGAGAVLGWRLLVPSRAPPPDAPAVVEKVRQVARLEALQVSLYKKISFAPEPTEAGSVWGDLAGWLRHVVDRPRARPSSSPRRASASTWAGSGPATSRCAGARPSSCCRRSRWWWSSSRARPR